jgi:predicted phosphodiesterase
MPSLIAADLHLNDSPRDDYRHRFLRTFRDLCRTHRINTAIVLGDLTDKKDNHCAELVNAVADHFYRLEGICQNIIVLRGNHIYISPDHPFFVVLRDFR